MTIAIDIRALASGVRSGVEEYTEQLLAHMLPLDKNIQYKLFYSALKGGAPDHSWLHLPNVQLYRFRIPNKLLFLGAKFLNWPKLDRLVGGADVFFFPHFFLAPLSPACKRVMTFHDISYMAFPEFFPLAKRLWHHFMDPAWQARMSDKIIAVSTSTKNDVAEMLCVDPAKVYPILSGVVPEQSWTRERLEQFRAEKKLPEKFILSLGTLEPRKNTAGLIEAFDRIAENPSCSDVHLVIAGRHGWLWRETISRAKTSPHAERIHFREHISQSDRAGFYQLALVFAYPSFLEGFGFPPLEAMGFGVPALVSVNSSMPEVVRDAALLADPYDVRQLADALVLLCIDQRLRSLLSERGRARASECTWDACARATLEVLTSV